ncbi:cupredoxin domain-containing protein [Roseateles violae]|uniref:Uncharacterized protein n=1 Tax=Roseateles violae TaxID=3058042 RepID=A0ABT8DVC6_9BURK|nr:hypothetical protein [Pelomonas sp. PFR6]MDN3922225.1 hypothetical protein [Pelomonas sp. PFR6]
MTRLTLSRRQGLSWFLEVQLMKNPLHRWPWEALPGALPLCPAFVHGDEAHAAPRCFDAAKIEVTDFGQAGDPAKATRTIRVETADTMRFTPAEITVRLVASKQGKVLHELVLGGPEELKQHAEMMKKFPGMEHEEPHMVHVKPGRSGAIDHIAGDQGGVAAAEVVRHAVALAHGRRVADLMDLDCEARGAQMEWSSSACWP